MGSVHAALPAYAIFEIPPVSGTITHAYAVSTWNTVAADSHFNNGANSGPIYWDGQDHGSISVYPIIPRAIAYDSTMACTAPGTYAAALIVTPDGSRKYLISNNVNTDRSSAAGINDKGMVCGTRPYQGRSYVFRWNSTSGPSIVAADAIAGGINVVGDMACMFKGNALDGRLFIEKQDDSIHPATMPSYIAQANPSGISLIGPRVCGQGFTTLPGHPGQLSAFLYDEFDQFTLLNDPFGSGSVTNANAIDFWGKLVVGTAQNGNRTAATVWEVDPVAKTPPVATDLNTVLPPNSGWYLSDATGVNSLHAICGNGFKLVNGVWYERGYLLVPLNLMECFMDPPNFTCGTSTLGTVTLSSKNSLATVVKLATSNPVLVIPSTATIASGQTFAQFTAQAKPVSVPTKVIVTASLGVAKGTFSVTVLPAVPNSFSLAKSSVVGGTSLLGAVAYNGTVAADTTVYLSSNNPNVVVPASVKIPYGATGAPISISTKAVKATANVTVTATFPSVKLTQVLTVTP